jgi:hypothetical protein
VFEILFLAFALIALLRWPQDVRRMHERKRSASPSKPEYHKCGHAAHRPPRQRPLPVEAMTEIGSLIEWSLLRHANDNKRGR